MPTERVHATEQAARAPVRSADHRGGALDPALLVRGAMGPRSASGAGSPVPSPEAGPGWLARQSAAAVLRLQRVVGNAAVAGLVAAVGRPPAAPLVQRYINVVENKESLSAFNWAMEYEKLHKGQVDFARMRAAFLRIEATGEGFDTRAALFQRATEVIAAAKEQAVQPLWREPSAARVAIEIDYHFAGLKPQPKMTLVRTYPTSWDTTGGWGAEYAPPSPENNPHKWVIHVHRGPNGGLKSAKVKLWEDRELPQKGMGLSKLDQLPTLGIPTVDTATTHK